MRRFLREESGQVIVDYILTLALILSIVMIIGFGFRRSLFSIWETITKEVSAACPGCPADPKIRLR